MGWIKNEKGVKSATLTFATLAVVVVLFKFVLSGLTVSVTDKLSTDFGTLDAALVGAILAPTLSAYVMRRHTDKKFLSSTSLANVSPVGELLNEGNNSDDANKQA